MYLSGSFPKPLNDLDFLEPIVSAAGEYWSSPQTLFHCSSPLLLIAKPIALSIGCRTGLKAKSFYSSSFLIPVVQIANHQYRLLLHDCEDHSLLDFTSAVNFMKYFIYTFTFIPHGLVRTHKMTGSQRQWLHSSVG